MASRSPSAGGVRECLLGEDVEECCAPGRHREGVGEQRAAGRDLVHDAPDTTADSSGGAITEAISSRIP